MAITLAVIALYGLTFSVLVIAGHEPEWPDEYGFLYSRNERLDAILGIVFYPAYRVARIFGIQRLGQPQGTVR